MQFSDFLTILWRRRMVVAWVFALCVLFAAAYAESRPKRYESTATIAFTPNPAKGQSFLPPENLSALLSTYAAVAKSTQNRAAAEAIIGGRLSGEVSTSTGTDSGILEVSDVNTNPQAAALTARAVAQALVHSIENNGLLVATIVNPAVASDTPLPPGPVLIVSFAALLGLIAGCLLALTLDSVRNAAENPVELTELTGLPVLGRFTRERGLRNANSSLVWSSPQFEVNQEEFRALRANVELLIERHPCALQVTSAGPGQGKSTVVANLGVALGQIGIPTTIVDADLRSPRQHEIFELSNNVGLSTAMMLSNGDVPTQETGFSDLSVLTSGPIPPDAPEMLHVRFRVVLRQLLERGGVVLVDSPPVLPVSDSRLIARHVDSVLFVVAVGRTRTSAVVSAVEKLRFAQGNLIGLMLNFAERDEEAASGYGYGYARQEPVEHVLDRPSR
jgi:polysaccharide biosynthesis transport protein